MSDFNDEAGGFPPEGKASGESQGLPHPDELGTRERDDAMGAYLMMFASLGLGLPFPLINIIASAVYYFVNRKSSRFSSSSMAFRSAK